MRCRIVCLGALFLLWGSVAADSKKEPDPEPPFLFTLEVNGLDYTIEPGELITLPPHKGELRIRVRVEPFRVLKASGVEFQFPRNWFVWREGSPRWSRHRSSEAWFVSHRGFRVEVRTYRDSDADEEAELWVERMSKRSTKHRVVRGDRPLRLGGAQVRGVTVLADIRMVRTAYFFSSGRDTVRLMLTEYRKRKKKDEPSETWKEMERWLQKSLKVVPE